MAETRRLPKPVYFGHSRLTLYPQKQTSIASQQNDVKGHSRHFRTAENSEPFRRRATVKSVTELGMPISG